MILAWLVLGVLAFALIAAVFSYNRLVSYRQQAENAWGQIDVQLKRRHDLIPNLVETVKGVMKFEQETLTQVMQARSQAMAAPNVEARVQAEGQISAPLGRLLAVWEQYPELKANQNASQLQEELTSTENKISYSRGFYNDVATNYNTLLQIFPNNLLANLFAFKAKALYPISETDKEAPQVKF